MPVIKYWDTTQGAWVPVVSAPGAASYAQVASTAPNQNNPLIAPPAGLLWVDTSTGAPSNVTGPAGGDLMGTYPNPQVDMALPAPLTSGSTVQSFTDSLGDLWVAKNGVYGGAYKRARDVLHCKIMRGSNVALTSGSNQGVAFDTIPAGYDPYGMTALPGITVPVAGLYLVYCQLSVTTTATTGGLLYLLMTAAGVNIAWSNQAWPGLAQPNMVYSAPIVRLTAGQQVTATVQPTPASCTLQGAAANFLTYMSVDYLGTG